ncbi:MAG: hypothetical protein F6J87_15975 [Spirulina sp. SIO3F2]|nr:hypothetical protein [Spirulina sp. SIO3F2]
MFILNADQVKYCLLNNPTLDSTRRVLGVQFQKQLYIKGKTYALQDKPAAIRAARETLLAGHEVAPLLVENKSKLTLWYHDPAFRKITSPLDVDLPQLANVMQKEDGVQIQDRTCNLSQYPQCFVGREAVTWLKRYLKVSRANAIQIGQNLLDQNLICHVLNAHDFKDDYLFYQFCNQIATPVRAPSTLDLEELLAVMRSPEGVEVRDRRYRLTTYPQCFVGSEAVDWFVAHLNVSREEAIDIGQRLLERQWLCHVLNEHSFKDEYLFYRFCSESGAS